jgi:tetratricopeptide (TPR) repeat protein
MRRFCFKGGVEGSRYTGNGLVAPAGGPAVRVGAAGSNEDLSTPPPKPGSSAAPAPPGAGGGAPKPGGFKRVRPRVDWKTVWPVPLSLAAGALLVSGVVAGVLKMPKDDPAIPLEQAQELYDQEQYLDALHILNADAVPMFNRGLMVEPQRRDFYTLRARSLLYGQQKMGIEQADNYKRIIEAFTSARKAGLTLEPADHSGLASAHLYLGEMDGAVKHARALAGVDEERRRKLYRRIVEKTLRAGTRDTRLALELLSEMVEMPVLDAAERAWVVARQAELRIAAGFAEEAAVRLLRDFNKFDGLDRVSRAELLFLLGKSYYLAGRGAHAIEFLEAAERDLPDFDERRGESAVLRGQVRQAAGDNESARESFERVARGYAQSPQQQPALLGLAESEAALGNTDAALKAFGELVEMTTSRGPQGGVTLAQIGERLVARSQDLLLQHEPLEALRFAVRAEDAFRRAGGIPAPAHLAIAVANRASAERVLAEAGLTEAYADPTGRVNWRSVSDVSETEAKGYLIDAGVHYRQHARQMTIADYDAQMDSLWNAADSFDRAGDTDAAIEAFSAFMAGARADYPRRAEGQFRLARVYESRGEYDTAATLYEQLISRRDDRTGTTGVWADRSLVPLARCYMRAPVTGADQAQGAKDGPKPDEVKKDEPATAKADKASEKNDEKPGEKKDDHAGAKGAKNQKGNDKSKDKSEQQQQATGEAVKSSKERAAANQERAVELLTSVVDGGRLLEPDAPEYKEALAQLGELHHQRREWDQAIARLRQALQRDPDAPRANVLRFKLADSQRQAAIELTTTTLTAGEPLSQRASTEAARQAHLEGAERLYRQVAADIARLPAGRVSRVERAMRRNSVFYAADCVYLAGRYAEAVRNYLAARDQYPNDPASLVALAQTVSALVKLGRMEEAQTIHDRAKQLLASIPESAWSDPDNLLPMERKHWEAWLESRLLIDQQARSGRLGQGQGGARAGAAADAGAP